MRNLPLAALMSIWPALAIAAPQCAVAEVTPQDGTAVHVPPVGHIGENVRRHDLEGDVSNTPAVQHIQSSGATVSALGESHGLRSVFARNGRHFQVFYITPDGQAVIGGVMWDAAGTNITRRQVASIPGTVPTVTIGPDTASTDHAVRPTDTVTMQDAALVKTAERSSYGLIGSASAPKLWMFIDPLCSYSIRAMEALKPYVASGRVQLAVVPVSVLDYEDGGRSTQAAQVMLSQPASSMVQAWEDRKLTGSPDPAAIVKLASNMATANALRLKGTPTFVWQKADGTEGMSAGVPPDLEALLSSIAS